MLARVWFGGVDLLALRHFRAVARREHVGRAAEALRVSQPSLSRTLARLEAELGVPLFDREGRRLRLNRFGAAFLARVDRALRELDDARRELDDAAGLAHGRVTVAAETTLTVAALVEAVRDAHPGVDMRLSQCSPAEMSERLRTGEVDLCFASARLEDPALAARELLREPVLLALPRAHHLAARESVAVAALDGEPFVALRPGHWQRDLADRLFAAAGVEPVLVCEGDEPAATLELVALGLGAGLVPAMGARAWSDARVVHRPLDTPDAQRTLHVVWRRDAYLSLAARHVRELAASHFGGGQLTR